MRALHALHHITFAKIEALFGSWLLPSLARFAFAATLLVYFWKAGLTKLGDGAFFGVFSPSLGAYAQIFPRALESAGYDVSQLTTFHYTVVVAGTIAEFVLPALIVVGLFTRVAAIGMFIFVVIQTLTDLYGHGGIEHAETIGFWFDKVPDSMILDQRLLWVTLLLLLIVHGAGPLSLDRLVGRFFHRTNKSAVFA